MVLHKFIDWKEKLLITATFCKTFWGRRHRRSAVAGVQLPVSLRFAQGSSCHFTHILSNLCRKDPGWESRAQKYVEREMISMPLSKSEFSSNSLERQPDWALLQDRVVWKGNSSLKHKTNLSNNGMQFMPLVWTWISANQHPSQKN